MIDSILDLWFAPESKERWFEPESAFDDLLRQRYERAVEAARRGEHDGLCVRAAGSLAVVLLLDQLPRNIWRGTPRAFSCDAKAREIADAALAQGHDIGMSVDQRLFLYLPFEHSESLVDQQRALRLVGALGDPELLDYAQRHHAIIERFDRFPHRNAVLGRQSTAEELAFLEEPNSSF